MSKASCLTFAKVCQGVMTVGRLFMLGVNVFVLFATLDKKKQHLADQHSNNIVYS